MAAIRRTFNTIFSSENAEPAVAVKRAGSEVSHPAKLTKLASTKDVIRKPLAIKSTNVHAAVEAKADKPAAAVVASLIPVAQIRPQQHAFAAHTKKSSMETDENLMLDFGEGEEAIEDIDKLDTDPQLASEYTKEIYQYMRELEVRFQINPAYMSEQQGVNPAMRTILIDWLVEVHKRFKLVQESLYLAVHILDRFLAVHTVARAKLQLVGLGCLLVASKYEDTWPPRIGDLIFIADKAYTREEIIAMECLILDKLEYNLGCPMPLNFLRRYSKVADSDAETHTLAKYLLEISLLDYDMCAYTYSQQAAASLHLSRTVFGQQPWNKTLSFYSGYTEADFKDCIAAMTKVLVGSPESKYQAVRSKFASSKMMSISTHATVQAFIAAHK